MGKSKVYEYVILWRPTQRQVEEFGMKERIVSFDVVLGVDQESALMIAATKIPKDYEEELDQVEVVIRPF